MWKDYQIGPKPSVSFLTLGQRFTVLRHDPALAWLQAYPAAVVRYALKYLADAYMRSFDSAEAGLPHFKSRHRTTPGFTIPDNVRMDGTRLYIPKVGWVRLAGNQGRYLGCRPKQVRILKEGDERHTQWYAHVFHEVPTDRMPPPALTGALGLDRNGRVYAVSDTSNWRPTSSARNARWPRPESAPGSQANPCPIVPGASAGNCPSCIAKRNAGGRPQPINIAASWRPRPTRWSSKTWTPRP